MFGLECGHFGMLSDSMVFLGTFVCNCVQLPKRIVCKILKRERDSLGPEREYFVSQITMKIVFP